MQDVRTGMIGLVCVGPYITFAFSKYTEDIGCSTDSIRIAEPSEGRERSNEVELAVG